MIRTGLTRTASVLALGSLTLVTAACAGPRVGEVIGNPSSSTMTIQARVVSATPVVAQVAVPRQVCYDELRQEPARSSGAGAVMGAIAGGAMGNAVGKGTGRAVATGLGVILGAAMGDRIEGEGRPGVMRTAQRCEQQNTYQNQVVSYNVVYEYGGQRYSTQMQREPGATIPVTVTVNPGEPSRYYNDAPQPYSYYQPSQPVVTRYVVQPVAPVTQVVYRPGVIVGDWDRHDSHRHGHHHRDRDDRWDDHDNDRRGDRHDGWRDDGRATFVGRR